MVELCLNCMQLLEWESYCHKQAKHLQFIIRVTGAVDESMSNEIYLSHFKMRAQVLKVTFNVPLTF